MVLKKGRKNKKRTVRKILAISAEGKNKTERNYFKRFNKFQDKFAINIIPGNETDPVNLVSAAISYSKKEELDFHSGDIALALIDVDVNHEQVKQIREAIAIAQKNNVLVICSNPCFEVWLFLHLKYSTGSHYSSNKCVDELKSVWPTYLKGTTDFSTIEDLTNEALRNAKKLLNYHESAGNTSILDQNPVTLVHTIVEKLV